MAPRTQAQRTRATIDHILGAARDLFATNGYDATYLDAIVERADMTKGALYHHFNGKSAVFAAVYEDEQRAIEQTVKMAAREGGNSWQSFIAGCRAFFEAVLDPGVQRITLIDAPAVLDWQHRREIEERHCTALLKRGIAQAIDDGHIKPQRIEPLAHLIHGAMCEAAMTVARSQDPTQEAHDALAALNDLLSGIVIGRDG